MNIFTLLDRYSREIIGVLKFRTLIDKGDLEKMVLDYYDQWKNGDSLDFFIDYLVSKLQVNYDVELLKNRESNILYI